MISVMTSPPGATIYIDGNPAGQTPKLLSVLALAPMTPEIKKRGYRSVTEHLYSTTPRGQVALRLVRERFGRTGGRAPRRR